MEEGVIYRMLKSRNYYAIKFGNGVQNIIVESEEELKKYVNPKYSVYKEFKRYKYAKEYLESSSDMENKIIEICKQIYFKEEATKEIQQ